MSEMQKSYEARKEKDAEDSGLEDKIDFPGGSPAGIRCAYCSDKISEEQKPVIRRFNETAGIADKIYHYSCAEEYAEDLKWINMPAEEKKRLLKEARERVHNIEERIEQYNDKTKTEQTSFLKEVLAVSLYATVPFLFTAYLHKNKQDIQRAFVTDEYHAGIMGDCLPVIFGGIYAYAQDTEMLGLFLITVYMKTVMVSQIRQRFREYMRDLNIHLEGNAVELSPRLDAEKKKLTELEQKIKYYETREGETKSIK